MKCHWINALVVGAAFGCGGDQGQAACRTFVQSVIDCVGEDGTALREDKVCDEAIYEAVTCDLTPYWECMVPTCQNGKPEYQDCTDKECRPQ